MKAKLTFIAGLAAGYVVGTRVGREGYESLKRNARSLWKSAPVQETISTLEDSVRNEAKDLGAKLTDKVSGSAANGHDGSSAESGTTRAAALLDVDSDPALNTQSGQDWTDEGGAMRSGPAG